MQGKEHIIQFGVTIDDDTIIEGVKRNAEKTITDSIQKELEKILFKTNYYGRREGMAAWLEVVFKQFLEENRDVIIEYAAKSLCESMKRTKVVREAAAQAVIGA